MFGKPSYSVTSQAPPLMLLFNVTRTTNTQGDTRVLGILKNSSGSTTEYTRVIGTFYNPDDKVVDCEFSYTTNSTLWPNQFGTFDIYTSVPSGQVKNYELQPDSG